MILPAVGLTPSGRPLLSPGEIEHDGLAKVPILLELNTKSLKLLMKREQVDLSQLVF